MNGFPLIEQDESYQKMAELLHKLEGIDVHVFDETFFHKLLQRRINETKCLNLTAYYSLLLKNRGEAVNLLSSLNISYSEFFRNSLTFAYLEQIVLPELARQKKQNGEHEIRIWSAATAAGQEAYSIAMLCDEYRKNSNSDLRFLVFGTDISESEIEHARQGKYHDYALNNLTFQRLTRYFQRVGSTYTMIPALRKMVSFSVFDLLNEGDNCPEASIFGYFDLVFCSNILFYYKPFVQEQILRKATHCMANGGYLVTGETEREIMKTHSYKETFRHSAIFQKN